MKEYLAKSRPRELIQEHTALLLEHLDRFFEMYGYHFTENERELIRIACQTHDLGKVHDLFQELVRGNRTHQKAAFPHGFVSGVFLKIPELRERGFSEDEISALVTAIHYHHARQDLYKTGEYLDFGEKYLRAAYEDFTGEPYPRRPFRYLDRRLFTNNGVLRPQKEQAYLTYVIIKGMLNKMDYAASGHAAQVEISARENLQNTILARFGEALHPAQEFMREHRSENVVLISPTGSGKTEGALLWLDGEKGFYTLPMKVSANAIYWRIHDLERGYGFSEIGLLHSDSVFEYLQNAESDDGALSRYFTVRGLAMPLTVSTVDQLFKFPFRALGTEIFAATLKYSRVIIDEMQMYSPKIVAILLYGLHMITQMGGKFAIITATLPRFLERLMREDPNLRIPFATGRFHSNQRRHIVKIQPKSNEFDLEAIRQAGESRKVLVLCNRVKSAQALKEAIPEARLIHARFARRDRARLEREIQQFAQNNHPGQGVWISTQLVEASLDIDFDELHTEMCTVDSLLQRMGRCYRGREYVGPEPNVYVYDHGTSGIYDDVIYRRSLEMLREYEGRIFTEEEKLDYIDRVYDEDEIRNSSYYQEILSNLQKISNVAPCEYEKLEADKLFREIRNLDVLPESVYRANSTEIEVALQALTDTGVSLENRYRARQTLANFTISIAKYGADAPFADTRPISGTDIYRTCARYDTCLGLLPQKDTDAAFQ